MDMVHRQGEDYGVANVFSPYVKGMLRYDVPEAKNDRYTRAGYRLWFSEGLVPCDNNARSYYHAREALKEGRGMATMIDEWGIENYLRKENCYDRESALAKASPYNDYVIYGMGINCSGLAQWTDTGLRVPKGINPEKFEKDEFGTRYYPRIVLHGDQEVGEILVPGQGVVLKSNEIFGLPEKTSLNEVIEQSFPFWTRFYFNPSPEVDRISGRQDLAIVRGADFLPYSGVLVRLYTATWERSSFGPHSMGFRLVEGLAPEINKKDAKPEG